MGVDRNMKNCAHKLDKPQSLQSLCLSPFILSQGSSQLPFSPSFSFLSFCPSALTWTAQIQAFVNYHCSATGYLVLSSDSAV